MTWPPTTHQDVEDDLTNGHGWALSLAGRLGVGETFLPSGLPWVSGRFYSSASTALATTTGAMSANRIYLMPIYFPQSRAVDQIAINVSLAGTAGHVVRLGLYNSSASTLLPTTVKVDAGTAAVDSTGVKALTIATALSGLFWLAVCSQSGQATTTPGGGVAPLGTSTVGGNLGSCLTRDSALPTSPLPDLTGDSTVIPNTPAGVPRVLLRAA